MKTGVRIYDKQSKAIAVSKIREVPENGEFEVVIRKFGTKSQRQRGLQWMWNKDISMAGIGDENFETDVGVHRWCKYKFARPILIQRADDFADLIALYESKYLHNKEKMLYFADKHISTEWFTVAEMAEYLRQVFGFSISHGVQLTDPDTMGLEM